MLKSATFTVDRALDGERLDRCLAAGLGRSRGWARRVIDLGGAYLGDRRVRRQSTRVGAGQIVSVWWADPPEPDPEPLPRSSVLMFERGVVVVDKPPGVYSQAARHRVVGTLPHLVAELLGLDRAPEPVNRLDRGTSGLVVMGVTRPARARLARTWADVRKAYVALVRGLVEPDSGEFVDRLGKRPGRDGRVGIVQAPEGRLAITRYQVLSRADAVTALWLEPLTGRTHQLRVQLASRGWPILGDDRYASPEVASMAPRLCLHATRLVLPRGAVGREQVLASPPPQGMLDVAVASGLPGIVPPRAGP